MGDPSSERDRPRAIWLLLLIVPGVALAAFQMWSLATTRWGDVQGWQPLHQEVQAVLLSCYKRDLPLPRTKAELHDGLRERVGEYGLERYVREGWTIQLEPGDEDTVGMTVTRPDGTVYTLQGGVFGWWDVATPSPPAESGK